MQLKDFCLTIDNSLDKKVCDSLVEMFKANSSLHDRYENNLAPQFTQLVFTSNRHINPQLHRECELAALNAIKIYKQKVNETKYWPGTYGFETFRIKHYSTGNNDQFAAHVDVGGIDSMKRFLAFFWYLNDVEEGGETEFLNFNLTNKPKKGTLFMFPPLWLYPHKGHPVVSNEKFLLSSYLHYTV